MPAIISDTVVNFALAVFVLFLSERLPRLIKPTATDYVLSKMHLAAAEEIEVVSLLTITSDFSATIGAITTAIAALIFEIWKLREHFPAFVEVAYLILIVVLLLAVYRLAQIEWLTGNQQSYEKGIGAKLKNLARVLAALLALFPLGEAGVEWAMGAQPVETHEPAHR